MMSMSNFLPLAILGRRSETQVGEKCNKEIQSLLKKHIYPFKPEFTIVISIHYKPRIAAAILDL